MRTFAWNILKWIFIAQETCVLSPSLTSNILKHEKTCHFSLSSKETSLCKMMHFDKTVLEEKQKWSLEKVF